MPGAIQDQHRTARRPGPVKPNGIIGTGNGRVASLAPILAWLSLALLALATSGSLWLLYGPGPG
jgi:hypothetical protein